MSRYQDLRLRPADPFHPHSRRQRSLSAVMAIVVMLGLLAFVGGVLFAVIPPIVKAQSSGLSPDGDYDCLVGEKMWNNRTWMDRN